MKLQVIRTGKVSQSGFVDLVSDYRKRLSVFIGAHELEIKADPRRDKRHYNQDHSPIYVPGPHELLILLDERGRQYTSVELSDQLQQWIDDPRIKTLSFLIGPPYGFNDASRKAAAATWSLSALTIPSDFAWLLVWEQLYRAMTILKGMPYHHD